MTGCAQTQRGTCKKIFAWCLPIRTFLAKRGKWFPKPLINQKTVFLDSEGPILDMTRKTGYICLIHGLGGWERLITIAILRSFFWASEGNGLLVLML